MNLIDFILNIVGLLLWLNWRAISLVRLARPGASLVATLKPATPPRSRWISFGILLLLLALRGLFYREIGPALPWVAHLPLWVTTLSFRCDDITRMLVFSALSFGVTLAVFYLCLLLLSCINVNAPENDPYQRFVQLQLGFLENLPVFLKAILPLIGAIVMWYALAPLLAKLQVTPPKTSTWRLMGQGGLIGFAFYLRLQYVLVTVLVLYVINSYVYFGERPFWSFLNLTGKNLLRPLRWIPSLGKIDFVPVIAIVLLVEGPLLASYLSGKCGIGLRQLFQKLVS